MTQKIMRASSFIIFFLIFGLLAFSAQQEKGGSPEKISSLGRYQGYSKPICTEWVRTSLYVPARDGTRLAVDILRPSLGGKAISDPLPVIWTDNRYHRVMYSPEGKLITVLDQMPWLKTILQHGYVVASVDIRGSGASFGWVKGSFTPEEAQDGYDITEWFAAQPWCSGKIGMFGISYLGITQYMIASTAPPHLRAIMPDMAMFDLYSFSYPGGVAQGQFLQEWGDLVKQLDTKIPVPPVDSDPRSKLLAQAIKEHQKNVYPQEEASGAPFRNSWDERAQVQPYIDWSPHSYLKGLQEAGSRVAIYHIAGWFDMWPRDALTWFNNLKNPQKILIAPWSHSHQFAAGWKESVGPLLQGEFNFDLGAEQLRFYDYWLKGIDNGIMNEPPLNYYVMGAPEGKAWRQAGQWPLPEPQQSIFYFQAGDSGSAKSVNDGLLGQVPPKTDSGADEYTVDYGTTTGKSTRWYNGRGGQFLYPDRAAEDAKGLTYTTAPLRSGLEVTGHPVVHVWVTSTAEDGDFFAYLEEVDESGYSHYVTEGLLRASHRRLGHAPYEYMGLPYHRSFEEDIDPLPAGKPVELVFDLHPTSNVFDAGHRIRLTVTCTDRDNFQTPKLSPAPKITIHRNREHPSSIRLPVSSQQPKEKEGEQARGAVFLIATLIVLAIIIVILALFFYLRSRLKK